MLFSAIAVAVAGVSSANTLIRGMQYDMLNSAVENLTGHIKIHAPGYRDDPNIDKGFSLEDGFTLPVEPEEMLGWAARIGDYFWHLTLPIIAMTIGGFAGLAMLTKNSFLDQINMQYVLTARAKGLTEKRVLYKHVFRNAMLLVIAGFPSAFVGILFTGSLFIEIIFSLDGLGLLGFEAALNRDYPVMFGSLYFFSLLGLIMGLIGDLMYMVIDPRIDFETRDV